MTYFYSAYYNQLEAKYGKEYMRAINRQFLSQQTAAGKEIWFSHDPTTAYQGTGFEMEVNWLKQHYGISEFNSDNWGFVETYSIKINNPCNDRLNHNFFKMEKNI